MCLAAVMTVSCLFTVPAVESQAAETHPARLVDDGDLLSEQEEKRLESRLVRSVKIMTVMWQL